MFEQKNYPQRVFAIASWRALMLSLAALLMMGPVAAAAADVVVYKSPTCGCCSAWVTHLEQSGLTVEVHNRHDMTVVKNRLGIPDRLRSCHTAIAGDYLIEGHVPADLISRVLKEKPQVVGLAVPGMPMGSPGMEGPRKDDYAVVTFDRNGEVLIYAER